MPPPNGSTGSTSAGYTSTAGTSRQPNWRPPTTVNTSPAVRSGAHKQSERTRRCDSLWFFASELAVRLWIARLGFFRSLWNTTDAIIIVVALLPVLGGGI